MTKRNVLTQVDTLKLATWVQDHHVHMVEMKPTCHQMANLASEELGFEVSVGNLKGMLNTLDLKVIFRPKSRATTKGLSSKRIEKLKLAIVEICETIGMKTPLHLTENW